MIPSPAPLGGRFPGSFLMPSSLPVTAGFSSQPIHLKAQSNYDRVLPACVLCPFLTLPGPEVSWCHPSVSRHHSPRLLSVLCRILSEPYTLPLLQTASSLMGFLCVSGNTHVLPWTLHFSRSMISLLHTAHTSGVSFPCIGYCKGWVFCRKCCKFGIWGLFWSSK